MSYLYVQYVWHVEVDHQKDTQTPAWTTFANFVTLLLPAGIFMLQH